MRQATIETQLVSINDIKPYWRNSRIGDVKAVKESIKRYGYQQPILLDKDYVIVVGHTRYKALQELGYEQVACIVADLTPEQAKEYRIVDNKTADLSVWDIENLAQELKTIPDIETFEAFFKKEELNQYINKSIGVVEFKPIDQEGVDKQQTKLDGQMTEMDQQRHFRPKMVFCPECGHEFNVSD